MKSIIFALLILTQAPLCFAQEREKTKADTNREVVRTYARVYVENGEYSKASDMLLRYLKEDGEDGNLWIQLGQSLSLEKKTSQACYAYQKASTLLKDDETRVYATYLLADCLHQEERVAEAKTLLERLTHEPDDLGYSAGNALDLINRGVIRSGYSLPAYSKKPKGKWHLSGAVGSGYDSNVLLVEENVINSTALTDRASYFFTPAVQAGYTGKLFDADFDSRYVAAFTDYFNSVAKSFNSLYQRADFSFGSGPLRWGVFVDTLFLNRNPFSLYDWEAGLSYLNIEKASSDYSFTFEIPVKYQKYILDSSVTADNDRTGGDLQLKANARWLRGAEQMLNLQMILEGQYTKGKNYRLGSIDVPLTFQTPVIGFTALGLTNVFSLEAQGQSYFQSDTSRRDFLLKVGAGVLRPIGSFNFTLDYSYLRNGSNVDSAKYHKNVVSLQLSREFL